MALAAAAAMMPLFPARAQTSFHDPRGRYALDLPAGWKVTPDTRSDQVILSNGSEQAVVAVVQQNKTNPMTAQQWLDATAKEFAGQCPTFQNRQSGAVTLAGTPGVYSLFTCSDARSPSVAETSSALTPNNVLVGFTLIAPLKKYYASLPVLDGIRTSLHLLGGPTPPQPPPPAESLAMTELKKACTVGAFPQQDCARRIGILMGQEQGDSGGSAPAADTEYRDAKGRFSLNVPAGWTATAEGDNGIRGVQLRSGTSWINILPAEAAASASEVVLRQEQKIAERSGSGRKPPFGKAGLLQLFGNGVEVTFDHFEGVSPTGDAVLTYIGGVGNMTGPDHDFLLMMTSMAPDQAGQAGATFLSVAQSVHLPAK
jgi:uncharacterized protein YbdZ (MbtH family)